MYINPKLCKYLSDNNYSLLKFITAFKKIDSSIKTIKIRTCLGNVSISPVAEGDSSIYKELNTVQDFKALQKAVGDINLHLSEDEKFNFDIKVSDGKVNIKKLVAESLFIQNLDGNVNIENCILENLLINCKDGDVRLENIVCDTLNISLTDGDAILKNVVLKNGKVFTKDGDILLNYVAAGESLSAITEDGDIEGKYNAGKSFVVVSSDGNITLNKAVYEDSSIHTSDGDVKVITAKNCSTDHIYTGDGKRKIKYFKKKIKKEKLS